MAGWPMLIRDPTTVENNRREARTLNRPSIPAIAALAVMLLAATALVYVESLAHSEGQPQESSESWQPASQKNPSPQSAAPVIRQTHSETSNDKRTDQDQNGPPYGWFFQLVLTGTGLFLSWLIYTVYDRQAGIMETQAELMRGQLKATQEAASAAKAANELAQKQLEYAHRARISIRFVEAIVWDEIGDIIIRYSLTNAGLLPAAQVVIFFAAVKDTAALVTELRKIDAEGIVIAHDETRVFKGGLTNTDKNLTMLAKRGDGDLFISVVIRYVDGFGETRHTWKRAWYNRDKRDFEENGGQQD
jgi:hypothetical protein